MARGVSNRFMRILDDEQRSARVRVTVLGILGVLLIAPAFLLAAPIGAAAHVAAVAVGLLLGWLWGIRTFSRTYQNGLVALWKEWMRAASGSETLAECHRKVMGKSGRNLPWLYAVALTLFWAAEVAMVALALANTTNLAAALPVVAINGLLVGTLIGYAIKAIGWTRELSRATREMIADGEVGVWGTE